MTTPTADQADDDDDGAPTSAPIVVNLRVPVSIVLDKALLARLLEWLAAQPDLEAARAQLRKGLAAHLRDSIGGDLELQFRHALQAQQTAGQN